MPKVSEQYLDMKRQQIIDAAYRCFAKKGFHQATMRDIYEESGLSAGAVYHYFKSKEDIIEASFAFDYRRSLPAFDKAANEPDPMVAIAYLIDFFYTGLESAAALNALRVNVQGWSEALVNPRLGAPLRGFSRDFRSLLEQLVERGKAAGMIEPGIDPGAAGEVILSSFLGLYLQKSMNPELLVEKYKEVVLALLQGKFIKQP